MNPSFAFDFLVDGPRFIHLNPSKEITPATAPLRVEKTRSARQPTITAAKANNISHCL